MYPWCTPGTVLGLIIKGLKPWSAPLVNSQLGGGDRHGHGRVPGRVIGAVIITAELREWLALSREVKKASLKRRVFSKDFMDEKQFARQSMKGIPGGENTWSNTH